MAVSKEVKKSRSKLESSGFNLDDNLGFLVSDVHRLITAAVDKQMKPLGLTRSQLRVLLHLLRGDGLTQVEIAQQLDMGKVPVGGLLDRLEEKDLIERKIHPADRRAKLVYLTKKTEKLYGPIAESGNETMRLLTKGISGPEYEKLISLLLKVKENSQKLV